MKKTILLSIAALLFFVLTATQTKAETVTTVTKLFEGEQTVSGWAVYSKVGEDTIMNIVAGDILTVTVSGNTGESQYPQVRIEGKDSTGLVALLNASTSNADFPYEAAYTVTEADVQNFQTYKTLYFTGAGITVTLFTLTHTEEVADDGQGNEQGDEPEDNGETGETIEVSTVISEETVVADDNWNGYLKLTQSQLAAAETGDRIVVEVTAYSSTASNPLVDFRNGSWTTFSGVGYTYVSGLEMPAEVSLTLTDDIIAAINGEVDGVSSGMIITGEGITFDKVSLVKTVALTSGAGKGNAVTNLWTGSQEIDWNNNKYEVLAASVFNDEELNIAAGMKLRVTFTNLKMNGVGRIVHNWTGFDGLSNMTLTTACGNYYEYTLTDDIISYLKSDGLRLSGVGYTATSIDLVDPDKEYNILASYDQSDIKAWAADEEPKITLTITNLQTEELEIPVDVHLMKDTWVDYEDYSQTITIGGGETQTVDVALTDLDPGFYRMAVNANNNFVCTYVIGYNPTEIGCENDAPNDFWDFWDGWKEALEKIDLNAELTKLDDYSTSNRNVYEVKVQSAPDSVGGEPVNIWLYYAEPVADGKYPTLIHFQGTDSGTSTPTPIGGDDNPGWCEITVATRGQMLSRVKLQGTDDYVDYYVVDDDDSSNYGFYAYEYGDKDKHYYRAAYLDCLRGVDFALSRSKVDADNIFAVGGSQGGCFTYVAAALSGKLKAIAPSITGHSDFAHSREIVTWPTNVFASNQTKLGWTDDEINEFNSYFDTKNFVSRITCPVISNFSLQDHTDAPHLNIAPYNLLVNVPDEDKEYSINQFLGHATASDWTAAYMNFFEKYLSPDADDTGDGDSAGMTELFATTDGVYYNLAGMRVNNPSKGIYISGGRKVLVK